MEYDIISMISSVYDHRNNDRCVLNTLELAFLYLQKKQARHLVSTATQNGQTKLESAFWIFCKFRTHKLKTGGWAERNSIGCSLQPYH